MRHDLEGGDAGALVHRQHAGAPGLDHFSSHGRAAPSDSRTTLSRAAEASAKLPEIVQPAAFSWPPPPKRWAMALTGTSPLPRRLALIFPGSSSLNSTAT